MLAGVYAVGGLLGKQTYGYTLAAPVKPQSFTAYANGQSGLIVGTAGANGAITGDITGTIETKTGFYELTSVKGFAPESVRYNTVVQSNIPLDSSIIGIDAVRLPPDGRVPIFRRGDMIVIGNKVKQGVGSAHTGGQVIQLSRGDLSRVCLVDANAKHINAELYSVDLVDGTVTWEPQIDLSAYTMPITAHHVQEEENRVYGLDINGTLKLQFATSRAYPIQGTTISSAFIGGNLLTRVTAPFSQQAWNKVWSNERQTDEIMAKLNVKDYPMKLASNGAITERWLLLFKTDAQFDVIGENLGLIATSDRLTDLAPPNPATGQPYFTLPKGAFGGGWMSGNCIRFNTFSSQMPTWVLRAVQPSPVAQTGKDGFTMCLRGNTVDK